MGRRPQCPLPLTQCEITNRSFSHEDLLSYEIGDIDVHEDGDDLDADEDELLMSDDEPILDDDKVLKNAKPVTGRASHSDKRIVSPSADTESSKTNKSTAEKTPKKRTLKRNVSTAINSQIPAKQVKHRNAQVADEQSLQNDGRPTKDVGTPKPEMPQNSTHTLSERMAEPVTPTKTNKNSDTCSLSELESPVASLVFSQSATPTTTTTSQDESCSCVDDSETESASLTQRSQDTLSVQNSLEESAATDDFDSDYNRHKADTELENSDDGQERMNARLCVERDVSQELQISQTKPPYYKNQRGALSPRGNANARHPQPNFPPQFNAFAPRPNNHQFHPRYVPPPMMAPPQNPQTGQRMDFRAMAPLNFRPPYPNNIQRPANRPGTHFTQHGHAVNRPNFQPNGPPFPPYNQPNQQIMGHFEPNGPMM